LRPELDWIVTSEAQNGYRFGYELGKRDIDFSLLPTFLEAQRKAGENASVFFLGGYFRSLFEKNQQKWEEQLDVLIEDAKLNVMVPELTWYIASFVPKTLFREEGKICLAREVLVRYGARKDVRSNLMNNFSSEGWTGPASLHYQQKKQQLLDFKKEEDNENVKRWIDEYVSILNQEIEQAKIEEERRGF
jgi:hypothetical protein